MKLLITIISFFIVFTSVAQKKKSKNVYNTKIDSANKVNIYAGPTTIGKVDTLFIGTVIINNTSHTRIFFAGSEQQLDSNNNYVTAYIFVPENPQTAIDVDIIIDFDKPLVRQGLQGYRVETSNGNGIQMGAIPDWKEDNKEIGFKGQLIAGCTYFKFIVLSKEKLFATIYGTSGRLR